MLINLLFYVCRKQVNLKIESECYMGKSFYKCTNLIVGYHGYWVRLTYFGLIVAICGICFALGGNLKYALICLMISGICDAFDGRIANLKERTDREKSYGIQIDALADIVNFGVLPAMIGYAILQNGSLGVIHVAIFSIYVLAALIRLAHFNVIEIELLGKKEKRTYYEGLPVTTVALIIPVIFFLCDILALPLSIVYPASLAVFALAFVLKVKIPKLNPPAIFLFCLLGLPAVVYILVKGVSNNV